MQIEQIKEWGEVLVDFAAMISLPPAIASVVIVYMLTRSEKKE